MRDKPYWNWVKRTQEDGIEPLGANMDQISEEDIKKNELSFEMQELKYKIRCLLEKNEYRNILSKKQSEAFELMFKHGMNSRQIANKLGVYYHAIDNRIRIAIDKVRSYLEPHPMQNKGGGV